MTMRATALALVVASAAGCSLHRPAGGARPAPPAAKFEWFEYAGNDSVYRTFQPKADEYLNPILAGFYPDPSIVRAGRDYYLVNSTFSYFPGLPIFHSRDLVSWRQIGSAIDRPSQLSFDSLGMSRGLFAPAISYHDGTFYIANTCVDCGGNFVITAKDPRGPWSDPAWLPTVEGIDPSLFFDDDGRAWLVNNRTPSGGSTYEGHRAIWIQQWDPRTRQVTGEATQIVNGGVDIAQKPIWIEGPHVYKIGGKYYLNMAEGGTAHDHRQVIMRADQVRGPYVPGPVNPILTQRHLDPARPFPITSAGHADYVDTPDGQWWAVFLGVRPYAEDYHNTGRETFMLPLAWKDGWPSFVGGLEPIRYHVPRPALARDPRPPVPTSGNFAVRDDFDAGELAPWWLIARTPRERWWSLNDPRGTLTLRARPARIDRREQPSFVGRRQQHIDATFTTAMRWTPRAPGDRAGLVAFQSDEYLYAMTVTRANGREELQLQRRAGARDTLTVIASVPVPSRDASPLLLRIVARGDRYDFLYATQPGRWTALARDVDARILSTRVAGGFGGNFTGVVVGPYAHAEGR
jgi:alpha-N-arabinofuranosidase